MVCVGAVSQLLLLLVLLSQLVSQLLLLLVLLSLLLLLFRLRHAAVVVAVYLLMEQCGGRRGDYEIMDGWLLCRRIMRSAERLSSKFHSFPPSFASRPAVHFSDNLSALGILLQYSSKPDRGLFVLKPSE